MCFATCARRVAVDFASTLRVFGCWDAFKRGDTEPPSLVIVVLSATVARYVVLVLLGFVLS